VAESFLFILGGVLRMSEIIIMMKDEVKRILVIGLLVGEMIKPSQYLDHPFEP
jgi:hypothetical protein